MKSYFRLRVKNVAVVLKKVARSIYTEGHYRNLTLLRYSESARLEFCNCAVAASCALGENNHWITGLYIFRCLALIPCALSAVTASMVSSSFGIEAETFPLSPIELNPFNALKVIFLASMCALVAILFCVVMHKCEHMAEHYIANPYLRAALGGVIIIVMTYMLGTRDYLWMRI